MSTIWRVRTNTGCDHPLGDPGCARCAVDRAKPIASPRPIDFYVGIYPHLTGPLERDITITSPQQLRDECKRRGLYSNYLEESMTWRKHDSDRWI